MALAAVLTQALVSPALAAAFGLEKAGWTLVTASDDTYVYMRAARTDAPLRQVWTAYDSDKVLTRGALRFRSVESLSEYDCRRRLSRVVQEIFHEQPGLTGKRWPGADPLPTPWKAAAPDSVGAVRMAFACRALMET